MGLNAGILRLLIRTIGTSGSGRALTYGVQAVEGDFEQVTALFSREGVMPSSLDESAIKMDDKTHYGRSMHQSTLLHMLGFEDVESLDAFDDEQPTHVLDLNNPVPEEMKDCYDLVLDGGTMEHCFDVPQVLENTTRLLKVGGRVVHVSPVCGWANHGFFQFSPILYPAFYGKNGFDDMSATLVIRRKAELWALALDEDCLIPPQAEGSQCLLFFSARKRSEAESCTPYQQKPEQHSYMKGNSTVTQRAPWLPERIRAALLAMGARHVMDHWHKRKADEQFHDRLERLY